LLCESQTSPASSNTDLPEYEPGLDLTNSALIIFLFPVNGRWFIFQKVHYQSYANLPLIMLEKDNVSEA